MMLLFVFSNWIFCGAAVAYGFRGEARCRAALGDKLPNTLNRTAPPGLIALAPHSLWPEIVEIGQLPTYNQDFDDNANPAPAWTAFRQQVKAYDAVLFVTPEYNYSVPGVLKNAIDWASRPYGDSAWNGKPAAIMGASTGTIGTARAQYHLRQILVFLNMFPINQPEVMIGNAAARFDQEGNLTDEATKNFIRQLLQNLVEWTRRLGPP